MPTADVLFDRILSTTPVHNSSLMRITQAVSCNASDKRPTGRSIPKPSIQRTSSDALGIESGQLGLKSSSRIHKRATRFARVFETGRYF